MELEQIIKRLEWLDDERRKDKVILTTLNERIDSMEGEVIESVKQIKEVSSEMTRFGAMLTRFDQIEASVAQVRVDLSRSIEEVDKRRIEHDREVEKTRLGDIEATNKAIGELRKGMDSLQELRKEMKLRVEEEYRLSRLLEELENKIENNRRSDEEYQRSQRLLEEGRRQDAKRLVDLQGEVAALRKRSDEQRGRLDLAVDNTRKVEIRIGEIQAAEVERKQAQNAFLEKQASLQIERDRLWKEWQGRFEHFTSQTIDLDTQLQTLDATYRAVKRAQEAFEEITERFERRINEITEMQRLGEERFRQEWVGFKADDQKRWTNYTLSMEEQQHEVNRRFDKGEERLVNLEDMTQELSDILHQSAEDLQKRMQTILSVTHEWLEGYQRIMGNSR